MKLYEEILFLIHFFEGKFCIENVISYYEPLIRPIEAGNHYFWTNFHFSKIANNTRHLRNQDISDATKNFGIDLTVYELPYRFKRNMINNLVEPELGKHILDCARSKSLF
jgi:DNA (cytosine-5)-methyltransferase 1